MDPMTMAMIGSAGANVLGGVLGGNAAKKAANQAASIQEANYQRNKALLESIGIPSIEAQEIALNNPEYVGDLVAEVQGETALKEISTDPRLRDNQMNQLVELEGLSKTGLGTVDRIALDEAQSEATSADKSRRASLLAQMAQRGTLDSGAALAAQLQSSEAANQQAMQQSQNIAKQSSTNRMNAINMLANQSGNMEQADYGRQANVANATDVIQKFNVNTKNQTNQFNLTNKQNLANQASDNANRQETYNKGLLQQDYNNRMGKAQASIGMATNNANNQAQSALTAGQGKANMYSSIGQGLGNAATAYGAYDEKKQERENDLEIAKLRYG